MRIFSWQQSNIEHIAKHGVTLFEAQYVVEHARRPFPEFIGDGKWKVWGKTAEGRYLQVIFVYVPDEQVDVDSLTAGDLISFSEGDATVVFVIHAMELTADQKRQARKRGVK